MLRNQAYLRRAFSVGFSITVAIIYVFCVPLRAQTTSGLQQCSVTSRAGSPTIEKIAKNRCVIVGVNADSPPMSFYENEKGQWSGFEPALARELARVWLGDENAVKFVSVTREDRLDKLENGEVDLVIATLSFGSDRDLRIDFSQSYFEDIQDILIRADGDIRSLQDLNGKKVAALRSADDSQSEFLKILQDEEQIRFTTVGQDNYKAALQQLKNKLVDAVVGYRTFLRYPPDPTLRLLSPVHKVAVEYQIGIGDGDEDLKLRVNCALQNVYSSPTWRKLHEQWLGSEHAIFAVEIDNAKCKDVQFPINLDPLPTATFTPTNTPAAFPTVTHSPTATIPPTKTATKIPTIVPTPTNTTTPVPTPTATLSNTIALTATTPSLVTPTATVSAIQRIKERGKLIAGVKYDSPPFGYVDDEKGLVGFEIDLMREFARRWLDDPNAIDFIEVTSSDRITKLIESKVDILAATMTHTKDRDGLIDFSQTYYLDGQNILVRKDSGLRRAEDNESLLALNGATIGSRRGSTSIKRISEFALEKVISVNVEAFESYGDAIQALRAGQIDAVTTDRGILLGFAQQYPELVLLLDGNFSREPYGLGVRAGDSYMLDLVNFTLQEMQLDGKYRELYANWFCDGSSSNPQSNSQCPIYPIELLPGTPKFTLETSPVTTTLAVDSVVDTLIKEHNFVAGVKYSSPPFGYLDDEKGLVGFEIDLMREFARRWLGDPDAVNFIEVTSSDRITKLMESEVDVLAATMTHNKPRGALIDFSQTYYLDGQNILVRKDSNLRQATDADSLLALAGTTIASSRGSTSIGRIQDFALEKGITIQVEPFENYGDAVQALLDKRIDAVTTDRGILIGFAQQHPELTLLLNKNFSNEPYGLGVRKHDHRFRDLVNFTLQEMKADGTYDILYRYWFGVSFILQEQASNDSETIDMIRRYWTDDVEKPVNVAAWEPYTVETWPGNIYFGGDPTVYPIADYLNGAPVQDLAPMVLIPRGYFLLGAEDKFALEADAKPQIKAFLDDFYLDQHEVTNHQYRSCVARGHCKEPDDTAILNEPNYFYGDVYQNHPVVNVTWQQAQTYCASVDKRLPTEAEWEKAARGPYVEDAEMIYIYPWGDDTMDANYRATFAGSEYRHQFANPVGIFRFDVPGKIHGFSEPVISLSGASPFDVLDLAGNVQEWVADCYDSTYYTTLKELEAQGEVISPPNLSCNVNDARVVRSSGFYESSKARLSTVYRYDSDPAQHYFHRGFRCAADRSPATRLYYERDAR